MTEKIPQHRHCRECGRAFVGESKFCSQECEASNTAVMKKKKRQLIMLYAATCVILILAVLMTSL